MVEGLAARLGIDVAIPPDAVMMHDQYGGTYGVPTPGCIDAIRLAARTEGLILDPVYTGKAMAGLADLIRRGRWHDGHTVVFWHTGGQPGLFAYADQLVAGG